LSRRLPYSAAKIDGIVAAVKTIATDVVREAEDVSYSNCEVLTDGNPNCSLRLVFWQKGPRPNVSLTLDDKRIRGVNYKTVYSAVTRTTLRGWHEHLYDDRYADRDVVPVQGLGDPTLSELVAFCLRRWNISVVPEAYWQRQLRLRRNRQ
jgi:hypothetical protein